MPDVNANSESIRRFASDLKNTITELKEISSRVKSASDSAGGWQDAKKEQFDRLVNEAANLMKKPIPTLENSIIRLQKMAAALERYNSVSF